MNSININDTPELSSSMANAQAFCGFAAPVDDHIPHNLDLNKYVIKHPAATFFVRAEGDALREIGILHGDLLVIDRSLTPQHNSIVMVVLNGIFTVKIMHIINGKEFLMRKDGVQVAVSKLKDLQFWGVVTHAIHDVRPG